MIQYLIFICLFTVAGINVSAADFFPQNEALSYIRKILNDKNIKITDSFDISKETNNGRRIVVYCFMQETNQEKNYAVFTESIGRYELFDYLIITDHKGKIKKVNVLKYRSEHGGEIASKKWLSQFENFSGGTLHYGKDVSAISGATLSAGSITKDIQENIYLLKNHLE